MNTGAMSELQIKFYINKTTEWYFLIFLTKTSICVLFDIKNLYYSASK